MAEELARQGYRLRPGLLPPLLHCLEQEGMVMSEGGVVAGKMREYHLPTQRGRAALNELRPRLAELVGQALQEDPTHAPERT